MAQDSAQDTSEVNSSSKSELLEETEVLSDGTVLIAGGGPVGLLLANVLAHYNVKSVLLERNQTTTKWPKMDLTNARSMEIFRKLGLANDLRKKGVPSHIPYTVLISSGLSREKPITHWNHPSVDQYSEQISKQNDGTLPLEPYQRISQAIFEEWLRGVSDDNPLIDLRFGWKVESVVSEGPSGDSKVKTSAVEVLTGKRRTFTSNYVAACDGASSKVRTGLGIPLDGGPVPGYVLLVHFKSKDLARIQKQGSFWHIFVVRSGMMGGAVIAQDEVDTWTIHLFLPLELDPDTITSEDAVATVFGGSGDKWNVKIDEVLVRSTYRPNIAVARNYSGLDGRVFLAGDSAHQNIPTGGYGMNMGIVDAYDLGWKLAAVINGYGGKGLLDSYEKDRRPVAFMSVDHSKNHMEVHNKLGELLLPDATVLDEQTEEGIELRQKIHDYYQVNDGENKDLGIEMGYRYESQINMSDGATEPTFTPKAYIPSTYPGSRAPHVFLKDGTAIFDKYGSGWTLVEFSDGIDRGARLLVDAAQEKSFPLKHVVLQDEKHAAKIWEKPLVLIRPDGHVSWRNDYLVNIETARTIIQTVAGKSASTSVGDKGAADVKKAFSIPGSDKTQTHDYKLERMGEMQH